MTQSNRTRWLIAVPVLLSMLILIPVTAGAETSSNSNTRSDASAASGEPNTHGIKLASSALAESPVHRHTQRELCASTRCKRREWLKHHPRPKYPPNSAEASWYGGSFIGRPLGCPHMGVYRADEMGVANKTIPCGTRLEICYEPSKRCVKVTVVDRGPYSGNREFDLQEAPKEALRFDGVGTVKWGYAPVAKPKTKSHRRR